MLTESTNSTPETADHETPRREQPQTDQSLEEIRRRVGGKMQFGALGWTIAWGLLAALLRLPGLFRGLWHDEIISLTMFARGSLRDLFTYYPFPNNHILHSLLMKLMLLGGEQEWLLRLPAYLAGVLAVPLLFHVGGRFFNARIGHMAALLLAVCPLHVAYSLSARGYTLVLLGGLLAMDGFWSWLIYPRQARPVMIWKAIGGTILATWSVPGAVWLIPGLFGAGIWTALPQARSLQGRRWLGKCSLYALISIPLTALAYIGVIRSMAAYAAEKAPEELHRGMDVLRQAGELPDVLFRGWPVWILLILLIAGLVSSLVFRGRILAGRTVFLLWFSAIILPPVLTPGTPARLFLYLLPPGFLMVAAALDAMSRAEPPFLWTLRLPETPRKVLSRAFWLCPILAFIAMLTLLFEVYPRPTGWLTEGVDEDWREAAALLTTQCPPDRLPMPWAVQKRLGSVHAGMGYYLDRFRTDDFRDTHRDGPRALLMDLQEGRETVLKLRLGLFHDIWKPDPGLEWDLEFLRQMTPWAEITARYDFEVGRVYDLDVVLPAAREAGDQYNITPSAWTSRPAGGLPLSESAEVDVEEPDAYRRFIPMLGSFLRVESEGPSSKAFLVPDLMLVPEDHQFMVNWALVEYSGDELDYWVPEEILRPHPDDPKLFGQRLTDNDPPPLNRLELTMFNESRNFPFRAQVRSEVEPRFFLYVSWGMVREHERLTPIFLFSAGETGFAASLCEYRAWTAPGPGSTNSKDQEQ